MKKILLTGVKGMFGQDFSVLAEEKGFEVIGTDIHNMDITKAESVKEFFENNPCDVVVHAAAYTNVDGAESDVETAFLINATGSENIARIAAEKGVPIVYISTDYVFDGSKTSLYETNDKTCPINVYGESKLAGEEAVQRLNHKHYICRTSWLYGLKGKNFVETIIKFAQEKPELQVVDDQTGCPTWTFELSEAILSIISENKPYGAYHTCGSGHTTWYGFAKKALELAGIETPIMPVTTDKFPRPARRPMYSVMNNNNICRNWEAALRDYIKLRNKEI